MCKRRASNNSIFSDCYAVGNNSSNSNFYVNFGSTSKLNSVSKADVVASTRSNKAGGTRSNNVTVFSYVCTVFTNPFKSR